MSQFKPTLLVVMDGIGFRDVSWGNAVEAAFTPTLHWLGKRPFATRIRAHGTAVGLPSDNDIGNSEVGHNALGAGRCFDQGAKLVNQAIESERIFQGKVWQELCRRLNGSQSTLHLLGLLSDGNVHSHEEHLYALMRRAKSDGIKKVRIHALLDGRDVGEKSAEVYIERLDKVISELSDANFDIAVASGGGRMKITMDRYEADWPMVAAGWQVHVLAEGPQFPSLMTAMEHYREEEQLSDQNIPGFVIAKDGKPQGPILDGDGVVFFNFRGDRAIEISRSFSDKGFDKFDRQRAPDVYYAGMMEYDADVKIPENYLVSPPEIKGTLGEYMASQKIRQFACSETQKFGHVTYFWNGNRSGYIDQTLEEYVEIESESTEVFAQRPWMKADEICTTTIERMAKKSFDFGRINFANGDMVGHTGDFRAAVVAVETVDLCLARLVKACQKYGYQLIVTADHGNCDDMFDAKPGCFSGFELESEPKPKTSHSLSLVPFLCYLPSHPQGLELAFEDGTATLSHVANTILTLGGLNSHELFFPSILKKS